MQRESIDDIRLDRLEIENDACPDERQTDVSCYPLDFLLSTPAEL